MSTKIYPLLAFFFMAAAVRASEIIIPMDSTQANHLKAYGVVYRMLNQGGSAQLLLNYRGGSFALPASADNETECKTAGISYQQLPDKNYTAILAEINQAGNTMSVVNLDKAPRIAVYAPAHEKPYDDAVVLALNYAGIPYEKIYDAEVLDGKLNRYTWLHIHHEDFTGQYGKFYSMYRTQNWYQKSVAEEESLAAQKGFTKVSKMKLEVCHRIRDFVAGGGYMFAMCSAPETFDMALAAEKTDICDEAFDHDGIDPNWRTKLDYSQCFAFENWTPETTPYLYRKSNIDPGTQNTLSKKEDLFNLTTYNAKVNPAEAMLCQNHVKAVQGFNGQSTSFDKKFIKKGVLIMGQDIKSAKYIHGNYGTGMWTWYAGHDPEDYNHIIGNSPTDLEKHPNSPGYRLILNNLFLKAANLPVSENNPSGIKAFPNPASTSVDISGQLTGQHYLVFDETGKLMQSGTFESDNAKLNVSQFPNGVYLLQLDGGSTIKILKEN